MLFETLYETLFGFLVLVCMTAGLGSLLLVVSYVDHLVRHRVTALVRRDPVSRVAQPSAGALTDADPRAFRR